MKKILFVCYGNICRSPSAQGIFEALIKERGLSHLFEVDSAGTHDFHIGKPPDLRAIKAAKKKSVDLSIQQCRQFCTNDFVHYDYIFVMDKRNLQFLTDTWPDSALDKVHEFIEFDPESTLDKVPDPFRGNEQDFDEMMVLLFKLCNNSIDELIG
jgi:protein-tyrosine phosphatase